MQCGESGKTIRRIAEAGKEREMHPRPNQVDAHEQRHGHPKKNAEQREPKIVEPDGLVVGAEGVARQEAGLRGVPVICAVAVVGHACSDESRDPPEGQLRPREPPSIDYIFSGNSSVEWRWRLKNFEFQAVVSSGRSTVPSRANTAA